MDVRSVLAGVVLGCLVVGCAGFSYRYYNIDMPDSCYDQGKLLGPDASKNLPLAQCKPDAQNKGKCVTLLSPEFFRMDQDLRECQQELSDLQRRCGE